MNRSLTLRRETLAELADADLSAVAGGHQYSAGLTCPLLRCLNGFTQDHGTCASGLGCPITDNCV